MRKITNQKVCLRTVIDILNTHIKNGLDTCHAHMEQYSTCEKSRKAYEIASERLDALFGLDLAMRKTFLNDEEY